MNQDGQVLTWQLTNSTAFAEIENVLKDLKERAPHINTIYIDDCCKLRRKIKSVFGSDVSIKLDLFHATQRITRTLRKKSPLVHHCTQDLHLVFRESGDCEDRRMSDTPSPTVILEHLDEFVTKWKDVKDCTGYSVFTMDTHSAIENLKLHITQGCLSGIPPGGEQPKMKGFITKSTPCLTRVKWAYYLLMRY